MRRGRREKNEDGTNKSIVYIGTAIAIIALISATITILIYWNNSVDNQIAQLAPDKISSIIKENENTSSVSTQMGKTVEEVKEDEKKEESSNKTTTNTTKATNTKSEEKTTNTVTTETKVEENNQAEETTVKTDEDSSSKVASNKPITFIKPTEGTISKDFAKDTLLYSETLEEWTTHLGVDIKAEKTTIVKAAAAGKVKSIKDDPRYGLSIIIEHSSGYETLYANLLSTEFVKVGEEVEQGSSIGTVGNTATFEIADGSHLHFEIIKDGENIDPNLYIE